MALPDQDVSFFFFFFFPNLVMTETYSNQFQGIIAAIIVAHVVKGGALALWDWCSWPSARQKRLLHKTLAPTCRKDGE